MIICPKCFKDNGDKDVRCSKCGASLLHITEAQNKENIFKWRDKQRFKNHMITGAILCFGLPTLFGLPMSILPVELLYNALFGILFGVPLGYCVSRFADSLWGGAIIGCGVGIAYCAVTSLCFGGTVDITSILFGIGTGLIPGAIMGLHVELDGK